MSQCTLQNVSVAVRGCLLSCVGFCFSKSLQSAPIALLDMIWDVVLNNLITKVYKAQKHSQVAFLSGRFSHVCTFAVMPVLQVQHRERPLEPYCRTTVLVGTGKCLSLLGTHICHVISLTSTDLSVLDCEIKSHTRTNVAAQSRWARAATPLRPKIRLQNFSSLLPRRVKPIRPACLHITPCCRKTTRGRFF
jgi:hypothetical protein